MPDIRFHPTGRLLLEGSQHDTEDPPDVHSLREEFRLVSSGLVSGADLPTALLLLNLENSDQDLPEQVTAFFTQVEQRDSLFRIAGQATLVECSDPNVLQAVLKNAELRTVNLLSSGSLNTQRLKRLWERAREDSSRYTFSDERADTTINPYVKDDFISGGRNQLWKTWIAC